ncbi:MAG TPA: BMP family ABC transporter substrate-binding protein [Burkholderiaceae bacterium]|nr:BMP family ABC transporter substrate-binding protein [Burkholderiaceae bacterium]
MKRRQVLQAFGAAGAGALAAGPLQALAQGKPLTVGVLYVGPRDDFGYNQAQAQAAANIKKLPNLKVVEEEKVPETVAVQKSMEAMINQDKAALIFATSFGYFDPHVLKVAERYPNVRFAHCGGLWTEGKHPQNVGSYFGYIDGAQYISGVVAGHMSKTKKLGFIAAKPIPQVLRNINAFTLGARAIDPSITTRVIFTGDWSLPVKEAEATNSLIDQGVDVVTCHVDGPKVVIETAEKRGIMSCGYHASQAALAPKGYLTGAEWDWSTPYKALIEAAASGKPMNNFLRGGLAEGFVKMSPYGAGVSAAAKKKADAVLAEMKGGKFVIFKGPIKDSKGAVVIAAGKSLAQTDLELEKMNYLVEGVLGAIPA